MITLYGPPASSAGRCYWTLEEIGLGYETPEFSMKNKDHKAPEFLKLNPNGKVPALVDGDLVLWESIAINAYLAAKYAPALLGTTPPDNARVTQWSVWSQVEYQPPLIALFIQKMFVPAERRDGEVIKKSIEKGEALNAIVDAHLEGRNYMVGDAFTLADLNVASVARLNTIGGISLEARPNLKRWLDAMLDRPARQKVNALENASRAAAH
ncbi:MAG: hypothetical protein AUK47_22685 [Deltaproteobacteria bacterium CG2_30_63_29]|nr:MAG: hypothetical protein AUK47_22685 [Deltaproteobacteria bacterium CG2_30_63_29]PIW00569.1 MAG: glutathione S-transferase family protein [Deltaproteobacteria bacterium CG17_big_fil_post_rev_8_21_14_2_50_63_7]PJB37382.1 MAG: glutathione S-transferase family protein [Deltaproteobacteria bacterium CG_4_9_14_3_um_filter_63_12]